MVSLNSKEQGYLRESRKTLSESYFPTPWIVMKKKRGKRNCSHYRSVTLRLHILLEYRHTLKVLIALLPPLTQYRRGSITGLEIY